MFPINEQFIQQIIHALENDEACYINIETGEIIEIPSYFVYDLRNGYQYDFKSEDDFLTEDWNIIQNEWKNHLEILPPKNESIDLEKYVKEALSSISGIH